MTGQNPYAAPMAETNAPGVEWLNNDVGQLASTRRGLSMVYFGIVMILLGVIGFIVTAAFPPLIVIPLAAVAIGALMTMVGPLFCLAVPTETGAKGAILGSVVFQVAAWICSMAAAASDAAPDEANPTKSLGNLLGLIGSVLFVVFMLKLSKYIGREDLAKRARNLLIAGGAILGLAMIGGAVAVILPAAMPILGLIGIAAGIGLLVAFLSYAQTVNLLRKALTPRTSP